MTHFQTQSTRKFSNNLDEFSNDSSDCTFNPFLNKDVRSSDNTFEQLAASLGSKEFCGEKGNPFLEFVTETNGTVENNDMQILDSFSSRLCLSSSEATDSICASSFLHEDLSFYTPSKFTHKVFDSASKSTSKTAFKSSPATFFNAKASFLSGNAPNLLEITEDLLDQVSCPQSPKSPVKSTVDFASLPSHSSHCRVQMQAPCNANNSATENSPFKECENKSSFPVAGTSSPSFVREEAITATVPNVTVRIESVQPSTPAASKISSFSPVTANKSSSSSNICSPLDVHKSSSIAPNYYAKRINELDRLSGNPSKIPKISLDTTPKKTPSDFQNVSSASSTVTGGKTVSKVAPNPTTANFPAAGSSHYETRKLPSTPNSSTTPKSSHYVPPHNFVVRRKGAALSIQPNQTEKVSFGIPKEMLSSDYKPPVLGKFIASQSSVPSSPLNKTNSSCVASYETMNGINSPFAAENSYSPHIRTKTHASTTPNISGTPSKSSRTSIFMGSTSSPYKKW